MNHWFRPAIADPAIVRFPGLAAPAVRPLRWAAWLYPSDGGGVRPPAPPVLHPVDHDAMVGLGVGGLSEALEASARALGDAHAAFLEGQRVADEQIRALLQVALATAGNGDA